MLFLSIASVALTAVAGVSAIVIPRSHVHHARISSDKPASYAEGYLENYDVYHTRYLALDCEAQHGTPFFDACCHPMLATETLAKNRAPQCNPANHVSSTASSPAPTSSQDLSASGDGDDDCDDDEPTTTSHAAAPTSTDSGDDCDDDEPSTTVTPTTHVATTSTHSVTPTSTHTSTTEHATSTTEHVTSTTEQATSTTEHTTSTHTTEKATSTKASPPATTSPASSGANGPFSGGQATFFLQNGQAGACGTVHPDTVSIAALQTNRYGNLGDVSSNCGRKIKLTNTNNGKSVEVTVADACPTCDNENDLDLSVGAFTQIATEEEGEVPITWSFLD